MYNYIKDDSNFYDLALALSENRPEAIFCDTESTGLDARLNKLVMFQVKAKDKIYLFDFLKLNNEHLKYLVNLLQMTKVKCVFHNTKFDLKFLYHNTGIWLNNVYDTMNCEALLNAGIGRSTYPLRELVVKYCGHDIDKESRQLFLEAETTGITEQMLQYSATDVDVLEDIYREQVLLISKAKEDKVLSLEMDLLAPIAKMEYDGVLLDQEQWKVLEAKERERLDRVGVEIIDEFITEINFDGFKTALDVGRAFSIPLSTKKKLYEAEMLTDKAAKEEWFRQTFNINSSKQLKSALGLVGIKTSTADKKVLKKIKGYKVIESLLEKSECAKRISTYGLGVLEFIHPVTGRIHTEFFNNGTATGRLSSGNPINLQNIPNAKGYRESFISSPDYDWLSADYSQQEFRLVGAVSSERKIIDAYLQGADMHTATASVIYNKPLKDINKDERYIGKTANFTIIYGGTEYALGKNLGLDENKSKEIIDAFNTGFPILSKFKSMAEETIVKLGYSITLLGRRRYNPQRPTYMTSNEYVIYERKLKREGFNHIIQGTAADITKRAMVNIYFKNPFGDKLKMLIQVHDEIDFETHRSITQDAAEFIKTQMMEAEQEFLGEIPAAVDVNIGSYWKH